VILSPSPGKTADGTDPTFPDQIRVITNRVTFRRQARESSGDTRLEHRCRLLVDQVGIDAHDLKGFELPATVP